MRQTGAVCRACGSTNVVNKDVPYACKLLLQELMTMGIAPRIRLDNTERIPADSTVAWRYRAFHKPRRALALNLLLLRRCLLLSAPVSVVAEQRLIDKPEHGSAHADRADGPKERLVVRRRDVGLGRH